jgi:hypothetical protein
MGFCNYVSDLQFDFKPCLLKSFLHLKGLVFLKIFLPTFFIEGKIRNIVRCKMTYFPILIKSWTINEIYLVIIDLLTSV